MAKDSDSHHGVAVHPLALLLGVEQVVSGLAYVPVVAPGLVPLRRAVHHRDEVGARPGEGRVNIM